MACLGPIPLVQRIAKPLSGNRSDIARNRSVAGGGSGRLVIRRWLLQIPDVRVAHLLAPMSQLEDRVYQALLAPPVVHEGFVPADKDTRAYAAAHLCWNYGELMLDYAGLTDAGPMLSICWTTLD